MSASIKKRILFIINPISGIGKQKTVEILIDKLLDKNKYTAEFAYTKKRGHATEIAQNAVVNKTDIVVAVGGDGSVNEVGKGIVNSPTILGIIPLGRAMD